jgi:hypothetical protein
MSTRAQITSARCLGPGCGFAAKPRASNANCTQTFCKDCCLSSSVRCRLAAHNNNTAVPSGSGSAPSYTPSSALIPSSADIFSGPYARMISPDYARKTLANDFSVLPSTRVQTNAYRLENQKMIKVKYWVTVRFVMCFQSTVLTFSHRTHRS